LSDSFAIPEPRVVTGDIDQFYWGPGAFAGRSSGRRQCGAWRRQIHPPEDPAHAADHFECAEGDIVIENGRVAIAGVPERAIKAGRTRRARQFAARAV
jgi:hypothetical protein